MTLCLVSMFCLLYAKLIIMSQIPGEWLKDHDDFCVCSALFTQFIVLSAMFWLNIISFDVWTTFRRFQVKQNSVSTSQSGMPFDDIVFFLFCLHLQVILKSMLWNQTYDLKVLTLRMPLYNIIWYTHRMEEQKVQVVCSLLVGLPFGHYSGHSHHAPTAWRSYRERICPKFW